MSNLCTFATSVLNQWAMDFQGNCNNIIESIREAKRQHARYRSGPELEVTGYGCGDHFYEPDTLEHSWEVLATILADRSCHGIVIDVGMPVAFRGDIYNCRVIALDGALVLIRPKQILANKLIYRENRWFTSWMPRFHTDTFYLPQAIQVIQGQKTVPIGDALLCLNDTCIGIEICQELWVARAPNIDYYLSGAEIIFNGNGSNHMLRKFSDRLDLVQSACKKHGGVYVYTNLRGCDGERVYYDGGALVAVNGEIVAQSTRFSLSDVEVLVSTVDLDEVRAFRRCRSADSTDRSSRDIPKIHIDFNLTNKNPLAPNKPITPEILTPEKEISLAPALWLWDNLRRSRMNGFFLPMSGGLDSSSVACLVFSMCRELVQAVADGDSRTLADIRRVVSDTDYSPTDPSELCSRLLVTCYMSTENNSRETRARASSLSREIGSTHLEVAIDRIVAAFIALVALCFGGRAPEFSAKGGSRVENVALQNVQARVRMVVAYLLAQLYCWWRNKAGGLLVLGSGNLDECLRGYLTKYDCSSADLNPIGSICKNDLKLFVGFCIREFRLSSLSDILSAPPTAELEPLKEGKLCQTDEADMGMTYDELSEYGKLRKIKCCGPYGMFVRLLNAWKDRGLTPREIADKVRHFFVSYSKNRHKMTVITPSYHVESYNCDDNRFDLRPYLYNVDWKWQFDRIESYVTQLERRT